MVTTTEDVARSATERRYFTVWRWHFYAGLFVAPFLVAKKDCELFIKWKGDAGGLQQIRGEKVWVLPVACMSLLPLSLHLG